MPYDTVFEPVVMGPRMFLGFNDSDKVAALDMRTGEVLWTFYSDGPVRFSPVVAGGRVYFTSDDGYLYCVDAETGNLRWKLRGGPSSQKVLGNQRIISAWPARGGPVLRDDTIYFAASIWPFMGTFVYAVDAETGKAKWLNDSTGADYIKQPHDAPAFAGVAPQGQLAATEELLLVPGGRSLPAVFDRASGRLAHFGFGAKGMGGSFVAADQSLMFVHTRLRGTAAISLADFRERRFRVNEPVLADGMVYSANTPGKAGDRASPAVVQAFDERGMLRWQIESDGSGDLIKAGQRLYAAGAGAITAIELPAGGTKARIAWSAKVQGKVMRLLAADGKLVAVTVDGRILVFGPETGISAQLAETSVPLKPSAQTAKKAEELIKTSGAEGYALWFGTDDAPLLEGVVAQSALGIVAVDRDPEKVRLLRQRFDAAGLYGRRIAVHEGSPLDFQAPPYIASLVVVGRSMAQQLMDGRVAKRVYESVRPYDGKLCILSSRDVSDRLAPVLRGAELAGAEIAASDTGLVVTRQGPLPGAANWTHAYGDIANTVTSKDRLVKAPLGLLWFGGNSNLDVLPRHGHGPGEQVMDGRLFLEGIDRLSARDVYTGRVLWIRRFPSLGTFNVYYDATYAETPLSLARNQQHIPGANLRGVNFVATHEGVYLATDSACELLDAPTGRTVRRFQLPAEDGGQPPAWGFLGVYRDLLLAGAGFADYSRRLGHEEKTEKIFPLTSLAAQRGPPWSPDKSASLALLAFDRRSGQVRWKTNAVHGFLHNGIVAGGGRIYCLDRLPKRIEDYNKRRGIAAGAPYRIVALDAQSGKLLWSRSESIFGTWLGYSEPRDILLLAGAAAVDRSPDEATSGMAAYRGKDGSLLWENRTVVYAGPCMIHHDTIITNVASYKKSAGAFGLLDGKPVTIANPLTGKQEPWSFTRTYGCNTAVACENLLTFGSGAAGYYDLAGHSGTGNFGGFKSGCTSNLIAADGVLNAPDYTRTCTCPYQNQTSLALVHLPEAEMWTHGLAGSEEKVPPEIKRVGINFGAPGDRRADDGTLWLAFPTTGGGTPKVPIQKAPIEVDGSPHWFRHHSSRASGEGLAWVAASGAEGVQRIVLHLRPRTPTAGPGSPRHYTVRMQFVEPDDSVRPGERRFDVVLQGKTVLTGFDIVAQTGGAFRSVVRSFSHVPVADDLTISLRPLTQRAAVVCGVEAIVE